jgi:hypothetical protein
MGSGPPARRARMLRRLQVKYDDCPFVSVIIHVSMTALVYSRPDVGSSSLRVRSKLTRSRRKVR